MINRIVLGLLAAAIAGNGVALAQQSAIKRTPLQKIEYPEGHVTITSLVEIAPGGTAGRHTHPGIEISYMLEGEADLIVEGQPDRRLKPGDSFTIPAGVAHDARVHGDRSVKVLGTYVVDRTRPLASPAP